MNRQQNISSLRRNARSGPARLSAFKNRLLRFARNDDSVLALARMTALNNEKRRQPDALSENQKGNALWFILVAIGLMGLLTVMMSRSGSSTNETGSYEQNVIQANNILSYAKNMENAVQNLLARGCSENELSFWHDSDDNGTEDASDDYYNASSPIDHSCHIFDVAGAGLTWSTPNENWLDSSESAGRYFGEIFFSGVTRVDGLAENSKDDLLLIISWLKADLCAAINHNLFSESTITQHPGANFSEQHFIGNYDHASSAFDLSSYTPHHGQPTVCLAHSGLGGYHLYHALHAR